MSVTPPPRSFSSIVDFHVPCPSAPPPRFAETLAMPSALYLSNPDVLFTDTSRQNIQSTLDLLTISRCQTVDDLILPQANTLTDSADISATL